MPESLPQWPVLVLTGYCFCHIRCCLQCMVCIKRNDTHLWKPLPLFCHFAVTNETLEDTNAAPEDPQAKLHRVLETYVCTNPVPFGYMCMNPLPFGTSLPICGRCMFRCMFRKTFQMSAWFFFDVYCMCKSLFTWACWYDCIPFVEVVLLQIVVTNHWHCLECCIK